MINDEQVNGSDEIVKKIVQHPSVASSLREKLDDKLSVEKFMDADESRQWERFAREDLASLLYPNICRTWNDSYAAFSYVKNVDSFSPLQKFAIQNVGSLAMYFAASKIKRKWTIYVPS